MARPTWKPGIVRDTSTCERLRAESSCKCDRSCERPATTAEIAEARADLERLSEEVARLDTIIAKLSYFLRGS